MPGPYEIEEAFRRESFSKWRENCANEAETVDEKVNQFLPLLTTLFEYLAEDRHPSERCWRGRTEFCGPIAARVWCLMYLVRPDLIEYESMQSAAHRYGVSYSYMFKRVEELKAMYPGAKLCSRPKTRTKASRSI